MTSRTSNENRRAPREVSLRNPFTTEEPLGPTAIDDDWDKAEFELTYVRNNSFFERLNQDKSIIIGRKGSGKTALLLSVHLRDERQLTIILKDRADLFANIVDRISKLSAGLPFVEQIASLWDVAFWTVIAARLAQDSHDKVIEEYFRDLGVDLNDPPYVLIDSTFERYAALGEERRPISLRIKYLKLGGISFAELKVHCARLAETRGFLVYVLMDSLEDYNLEALHASAAMSGLLKCIGEFQSFNRRIMLRCCLPAERYLSYLAISSNPLKDFRSFELLHWNSRELIELAGVRFASFLEIHEPEFHKKNVKTLKLHDWRDLSRFWGMLFPSEIVNTVGDTEKPLPYIVRHTQLLPRQFIHYLNTIFSLAISRTGSVLELEARDIVNGVRAAEDLIVGQILEAYRRSDVDILVLCKSLLPHLTNVFDSQTLDKGFARMGKKNKFGKSNTELLQLLIEIGAIGRVTRMTQRYAEGLFEYMLPQRLTATPSDRYCVHPAFTAIFGVRRAKGGVPVYTYWSQLADDGLEIIRGGD